MSKRSEDRVEALAAACAEKVKQLEFSVKQSAFDSVRQELETELAIARVALLALREREEPVEHEAHIRREVNAGGNTWIQCSKQAFEREKARGALCRVLYESPPAPVVPAETFDEWSRRCEIQLTLCRPEFREVAEITWKACCAAMLAAPGKQPLSVEMLAGALRNAPLAPSDNQGRQREPASPQGWKLVPEEPTQEMIQAAMDCEVMSMDTVERDTYKAMLAAAPGKEG
ncbi:hypothetical protein [Cronobacter dublinensis]|uniref:hypothetical protein n=1 Tax=Cronobacter dublinensis TaxID=413497 RepID=UPI000CFDB995|nr:hypothetical protein [Cronobacter dublinensis]